MNMYSVSSFNSVIKMKTLCYGLVDGVVGEGGRGDRDGVNGLHAMCKN